jgi:hypothetical protein
MAMAQLNALGPAAKAAVPTLVAILKERPPRLHGEVISTLRRIDPEAAKQAEAP